MNMESIIEFEESKDQLMNKKIQGESFHQGFIQNKPSEHPFIWDEIRMFLQYNNIPYEEIDDYFQIIPAGDKQVVRIYPIKDAYDYRFGMFDDAGNGVAKKFFWEISHANDLANIRTIWIKPWEWLKGSRMRNVVASYIINASGITGINFAGRDTEIREVSNKELRPFLEQNSFYGYRAASTNLGLYLKKEKYGYPAGTLLMVYTFGYPYFGAKNGKYDCEVIRASTLIGTNVRGGASKLFQHFVNNYPALVVGRGSKNEREVFWNRMCYFVDFDHNNGNSLPHLGFDFLEYSGPGFMNVYKETGIPFHRKPLQHKQIMQDMRDGKIYSVHNAGVKTFIYDKRKKAEIKPDSDFVSE
jgi:hypothetical protein